MPEGNTEKEVIDAKAQTPDGDAKNANAPAQPDPEMVNTVSAITTFLQSMKAVGLPTTVAAIVSALITITPFVFKIDERYAKATELEESIEKNRDDMHKLTVEISKVAGAVDILSEVVGQQYRMLQNIDQTNQRIVRNSERRTVDRPRSIEEAASPRPVMAAPPAPRIYLPSPPVASIEEQETISMDPPSIVNDEVQDISKSLDSIKRTLNQSRKNLDAIQEQAE